MFERVTLSNGAFAVVDDADARIVEPYVWHQHVGGYAVGSGGRPLMHRLIMAAPKGVPVDHRDGNRLNNRRANLRLSDAFANGHNRHASERPAGLRVLSSGRIAVYLWVRNKNLYIGSYDSFDEAVKGRALAELLHLSELSPAVRSALRRSAV